jgi:hypothetical protein
MFLGLLLLTCHNVLEICASESENLYNLYDKMIDCLMFVYFLVQSLALNPSGSNCLTFLQYNNLV